jgi:tetratricopeptide (TPR) repeat protein
MVKQMIFLRSFVMTIFFTVIGMNESFSQSNESYNHGMSHYDKMEYNLAIEQFKKVVEQNPNDSRAWFQIGMSYLMQQEIEDAIENLTKSIQLDKKFADAFNARGLAHSYKEDLDLATIDFDRAIMIDPNFSEAYINRGSAFLSQDKVDLAKSDFDYAIKIDPSNPSSLFLRGSIYSLQGNPDGALIDFKAAVKKGMNNPTIYFEIGNLYFTMGDYKNAIKNYSESINMDSKYHEAINNRAMSYDALGEASKARKDRDRLSELAGFKFTPQDKIRYKTFYSKNKSIALDLPSDWIINESSKDKKDFEELKISVVSSNSPKYEISASVVISLHKDMKEKYGKSSVGELLDFWSGSNAKNTGKYANYQVAKQVIKQMGDFSTKLYETIRQQNEGDVVYRTYEFVAAKEGVLYYAYFESPNNQFEYYREMFDKSIKSIKIQ